MGTLFLDTSAWFAALSPPEAGHDLARRTLVESAARGIRLVTTSMVVAETHSLLLRWRDPRAGRRFLAQVFDSADYQVEDVDRPLIRSAIARWIARYGDQRFSLCDAVSFEVMRAAGIRHAITFDRHFRTAGFGTLG